MSAERNGYTPWYIEKDYGIISREGHRDTERRPTPAYIPIYYVPII